MWDIERDEIIDHLWTNRIEVLVLLEGIDPITSSTLQARHSYIAKDIKMDHEFARCVTRDAEGKAVIDFGKFHKVIPIKSHKLNPKVVQSRSHG